MGGVALLGLVGIANRADQGIAETVSATSMPTQAERVAAGQQGSIEFRSMFREIMERDGYSVTSSNVDLALEIGIGTCELLDAGETLEGLFIELFETGDESVTDAISTAMAVAVVSLCDRHEWQLDTLGS